MSKHPDQRLLLLTPLMRLALAHVDELPPPERADVYEGLAAVLAPLDIITANAAQATCDTIREAEACQLHFRNLFTSDPS